MAKITIPVTTYHADGSVTHSSFEVDESTLPPPPPVDFWCRCGNPSEVQHYHPDSEDGKHHWTCADCGKVTQIG